MSAFSGKYVGYVDLYLSARSESLAAGGGAGRRRNLAIAGGIVHGWGGKGGGRAAWCPLWQRRKHWCHVPNAWNNR